VFGFQVTETWKEPHRFPVNVQVGAAWDPAQPPLPTIDSAPQRGAVVVRTSFVVPVGPDVVSRYATTASHPCTAIRGAAGGTPGVAVIIVGAPLVALRTSKHWMKASWAEPPRSSQAARSFGPLKWTQAGRETELFWVRFCSAWNVLPPLVLWMR
jgi:hypothetical protein